MDNSSNEKDRDAELRSLFPGMSEDERREAGRNLDQYLQMCFRVFRRIQDETTGSEKFDSPWTVPEKDK